MSGTQNQKKPMHVFMILLILICLASALTYVVPSGEFERVENAEGTKIVIDGSYHEVESTTVEPWKIPSLFYKALIEEKTAKLIFFIFIIGGSFEIIMKTGVLITLCENMLGYFKDRKVLMIPVFLTIFSIFGFTMGLSTASVVFVPVGIAAAKILKFDKLTGTAMVALGTNAGFAAGIFNPFSVGIAQTLADVPIFSGAWIRVLLLIALLIATSLYLVRYALKNDQIDKNEFGITFEEKIYDKKLSFRQKIILLEFILMFIFVIYGVTVLSFETAELSTIFLCMGILIGITAGFGAYQVCELFADGCKKMVKGSLVIGMAATMRLVLNDGNILDTITYRLTNIVCYFPKWANLMVMFYSNAVIDLAITSGSAHAAVVMPIMTPMSDVLGLSRQSTVFAFQLGDGLVNLVSPISTTLTGVLAISDIPYQKWIRFFLPLVGIYMLIGTAFIILAGVTGY